MLNPIIELIASVVHLYSLVVITWVVVSLLINFDIINRYNPLVSKIFMVLSQLVEPALEPIRRLLRRLLPGLHGIDLSPIVLLLLLNFVVSALFQWFWTI